MRNDRFYSPEEVAQMVEDENRNAEQDYCAAKVAEKVPTLAERAGHLRAARETLETALTECAVLHRLTTKAELRRAFAAEEVDRAERWFNEAAQRATRP